MTKKVKFVKTKADCIGYSIPTGFELDGDGKTDRSKPIRKQISCGISFDTLLNPETKKVSQPRCPVCRFKHLAIRRVQAIEKQAKLLANLANAQYKTTDEQIESVCATVENAVALATDALRGQQTVQTNVFTL